ncbi:hypothetical protein [Gorillibacterium sp. sgz500922]|uniref:hypothetical protein n=1 Tax=Gorillibacterium sp. sgz500922 TaxID=3446694 RepID=UPI003F670329
MKKIAALFTAAVLLLGWYPSAAVRAEEPPSSLDYKLGPVAIPDRNGNSGSQPVTEIAIPGSNVPVGPAPGGGAPGSAAPNPGSNPSAPGTPGVPGSEGTDATSPGGQSGTLPGTSGSLPGTGGAGGSFMLPGYTGGSGTSPLFPSYSPGGGTANPGQTTFGSPDWVWTQAPWNLPLSVPGGITNPNFPGSWQPSTSSPGSLNPSNPSAGSPSASSPAPKPAPPKESFWDRVKDWGKKTFDSTVNTLRDAATHVGDWLQEYAPKIGRGILVGLVGAGIIIGAVVVVGLILGTTIASPIVLAVAAVAAIGVGIYYSLTAVDFDFWKGVANSAFAALTVVTLGRTLNIGSLGQIAGFFRSGLGSLRSGFSVVQNLFRAGGIRGLLQGAASGARTFGRSLLSGGRSLLGGLKNGLVGAFRNPAAFVSKHLWNKAIRASFTFNFIANTSIHMLNNGIPSAKDGLLLLAQSALSTFFFEKLSKGAAGRFVSTVAKRTSEFVLGAVETLAVNRLKGKDTSTRELLLGGYLKTFFVKPSVKEGMDRTVISRLVDKARKKAGVGTTWQELLDAGITPVLATKRAIADRTLNRLYKSPFAARTIQRLKDKGEKLTAGQIAMLEANGTRMNQIVKEAEEKVKYYQKTIEKAANEGIKQLIKASDPSAPAQSNGKPASAP